MLQSLPLTIHILEGNFGLHGNGNMYLITTDHIIYDGNVVFINGLTCIECEGEYYAPLQGFYRIKKD